MKRHLVVFALTLTMGAGYAAPVPMATQDGVAVSISYTTAAETWPEWLTDWLDQGGPMPDQLVADVIHEAAGWGAAVHGLSEQDMLEKYATGELKIVFDPSQLPDLTFQVTYGGGLGIAVILDNY